jgi:hypothetical protein
MRQDGVSPIALGGTGEMLLFPELLAPKKPVIGASLNADGSRQDLKLVSLRCLITVTFSQVPRRPSVTSQELHVAGGNSNLPFDYPRDATYGTS